MEIKIIELSSGGCALFPERCEIAAIIVSRAVGNPGWTATLDGKGVDDPARTYEVRDEAIAAAEAALERRFS